MDVTVESRLSFTAGVMVFLLGAVVMIGWHAQLSSLLRFFPTFHMMRYNAALGFSLLGFGLVATNLSYRGLSIIMGGVAGLLGMLTLLEYLFSTDLGIDELFMRDYFQANPEKPGLMSPISAACLFITGAALITTNLESGLGQRLMMASGILCAISMGLAFGTILGFVADVPEAYMWGQAPIALHAAMGFVIAGTGILPLTWRKEKTQESPYGFPVATAVFFSIIALSLWHAMSEVSPDTILDEVVMALVILMGLLIALGIWFAQRESSRSREIERQRDVIRAVVLNANDAIIAIRGTEGLITLWNKKAEEMFGYPANETLGKSVHRLVVPERYREKADIGVKKFLETGKGEVLGKILEIKALRRDGSEFPVELSLAGMMTGGGWEGIVTVRDISKRKKMEEELRISERKHTLLFEGSRDALMMLAPPSWKFAGANRATLELFRASSVAEFITLGPWELSPERQPDGRLSSEKALEMISIAMREGSHFFEWQHRRRDGQPFHVDVLLTRMEVGKEVFLQATVRDITERKKMETALRESEARFHRIVENAPFMLGICDPAGHIHYINKRHQETFGYPLEKIPTVADWMLRAYPDEGYRRQVINQWNDDIRRMVAGELSTSPVRTYRVTAADGKIRDMEITFTLIGGLMYVVFYDVTERIRAQEEVLKLMYAVEQSPVSVVITDKDGNIQYVNDKFCRLTGYPLAEAVGKTPRILKSGEQTQEFYKDLWDTILSGKEWRGRLQNKKKNGDLYWENVKISPVRNAQGETTHFIAVKEDITQQIEDEKKLRFAERQVMQSEKLAGIGRLSAGVCHEILNPLNIISIQVQLMLRREKENLGLTDRLTKIRGEIGRIEKIVGSLTAFSRKGTPELKPVKINDELDLALGLIEKDFNIDSIKIIRDFQSPLPEIEVDADEMRQVFLNCINNARYEMCGGGTLSVKTRLEKIEGRDHVRICFADTGSGIKKENLVKIFDPFFTTKPEGKGAGMGLSMTHSIIEKHGGAIRAESEEGKGATFIIDLPAKQR